MARKADWFGFMLKFDEKGEGEEIIRKMEKITRRKYSGLCGYYFNRVLDKLIEYGNLLHEPGIILDFGCGCGQFSERLLGSWQGAHHPNILGYDIVKEVSDVEDYSSLAPSKIVCSGVLEHLSREELTATIGNFLKMHSRPELIVFLPTENLVSRMGMFLLRHPLAHSHHKIDCRLANRIIERHYVIEKRCYMMFGMAQVTRYRLKENKRRKV